ncbi:MAG: hypothetical protein LRY36_01090 [Alphaproteobacteria bacterium]|nr:hypothetical protein [Alphaproteobacteria bacterium]
MAVQAARVVQVVQVSSNKNSAGTGTGTSGAGTGTGTSAAGTGTATTSTLGSNGLGGGAGTTCWKPGVKVTAYGYTGDHTPDSNSNYRCKAGGKCVKACEVNGACGIGNRNNLLRENHSFAISSDIVSSCGLKVGNVICVTVDQGEVCGVYEDTSPQTNNIDRYLPNVSAKEGNNYFKKSQGLLKKLNEPVPIIPHPGK